MRSKQASNKAVKKRGPKKKVRFAEKITNLSVAELEIWKKQLAEKKKAMEFRLKQAETINRMFGSEDLNERYRAQRMWSDMETVRKAQHQIATAEKQLRKMDLGSCALEAMVVDKIM